MLLFVYTGSPAWCSPEYLGPASPELDLGYWYSCEASWWGSWCQGELVLCGAWQGFWWGMNNGWLLMELTTVQFANRGPKRSVLCKNLDVWLAYIHRCNQVQSGRITRQLTTELRGSYSGTYFIPSSLRTYHLFLCKLVSRARTYCYKNTPTIRISNGAALAARGMSEFDQEHDIGGQGGYTSLKQIYLSYCSKALNGQCQWLERVLDIFHTQLWVILDSQMIKLTWTSQPGFFSTFLIKLLPGDGKEEQGMFTMSIIGDATAQLRHVANQKWL